MKIQFNKQIEDKYKIWLFNNHSDESIRKFIISTLIDELDLISLRKLIKKLIHIENLVKKETIIINKERKISLKRKRVILNLS